MDGWLLRITVIKGNHCRLLWYSRKLWYLYSAEVGKKHLDKAEGILRNKGKLLLWSIHNPKDYVHKSQFSSYCGSVYGIWLLLWCASLSIYKMAACRWVVLIAADKCGFAPYRSFFFSPEYLMVLWAVSCVMFLFSFFEIKIW